MSKPSRFDYVKYDEKALDAQETFKELVVNLEEHVEVLKSPRAKAPATGSSRKLQPILT